MGLERADGLTNIPKFPAKLRTLMVLNYCQVDSIDIYSWQSGNETTKILVPVFTGMGKPQ